MTATFVVAAAVAVVATAMVITRSRVVHALLYLVLSFLAVAVVIFTLGAPFIAALEVVVYAGAIIVLFLFVVMLLDLGAEGAEQERSWTRPRAFVLPVLLAAVLLSVLLSTITRAPLGEITGEVPPVAVGLALYGPYVLAVEIASVLLLAGAVGAFHLGRRTEHELEARVELEERGIDRILGPYALRPTSPVTVVSDSLHAAARSQAEAAAQEEE
jgi:NADH-quinone oxidoreductase subunit J